MILAGTGHRRIGGSYGDNPLARAVVARMGAELDRLKPTRVISGMALGVDQWLAWLAVRREIPFTAATPFEGFELTWTMEQRAKYYRLLQHAAETVIVSAPTGQERKQFGGLNKYYQRRNEWMVDRCDVMLAVWDGSEGGTANCVRYAQRVGREIVPVDPREVTG